MLVQLLQHARTVFVAALVLAIPAYALHALAAPRSGNVAIASEDDPIRNGLDIISRPTQRPKLESARRNADSDLILLTDWMFTGKGKPSPYN